jgi:uncharacterized protein (TIRG00374 family)
LILVLVILWYLIHSKKLDLSALQIYFNDPFLLLMNISVWVIGSVFLTSFRWQLLLKGMNVHLPFKKILNLNCIGFFFNLIAPGAVGGDLVKAFYLFRDQQHGNRTPAMLAIFLDRIVGLYSVFLIAALGIVGFYSHFSSNKILSTIAFGAVLGFLVMTVFFASLFLASKPVEANLLYRFLEKPYPGFSFLKKIYLSLFMLKETPGLFFKAVFVGTLYQAIYMGLFAFVTVRMGNPFSIPDFAAIFPLGFLAAALPIAPGGLGVGHLAFEQLFALIGVANGANIYNCVFLGQSALNLLGVIPYLLLKKGHKIPSTATVPH